MTPREVQRAVPACGEWSETIHPLPLTAWPRSICAAARSSLPAVCSTGPVPRYGNALLRVENYRLHAIHCCRMDDDQPTERCICAHVRQWRQSGRLYFWYLWNPFLLCSVFHGASALCDWLWIFTYDGRPRDWLVLTSINSVGSGIPKGTVCVPLEKIDIIR